ncbi:MAG: hypothetical protein M3N97_06925, partial [Pseudomonadota bacterium]|nr:hypothetical protein [Pseudomonadota bacterium]
MNAVVPLPVAPPADRESLPPEPHKAANAVVPAVSVPAAPPVALDEAAIAGAMAEAARTGRSAIDVLTLATGRTPTDLAQALAKALDYRFVDADELGMLEPAFNVLPPSEATRRCCAVVRTADG